MDLCSTYHIRTCSKVSAGGFRDLLIQGSMTFALGVTPVLVAIANRGGRPLTEGGGRVLAGGAGRLGTAFGGPDPGNHGDRGSPLLSTVPHGSAVCVPVCVCVFVYDFVCVCVYLLGVPRPLL